MHCNVMLEIRKQIELVARTNNLRSDNKVAADIVAIGHMRMSPHAATSLRNAIDQALKMAEGSNEPKH